MDVFRKKNFGGVGRGRDTWCPIVLARRVFCFGFSVLRVTRFVTRFVTRRDEKNFRGVGRGRFGLTTTAPRDPPTGGGSGAFRPRLRLRLRLGLGRRQNVVMRQCVIRDAVNPY